MRAWTSLTDKLAPAEDLLAKWPKATHHQRHLIGRLFKLASSLPPQEPVFVHGDLKPENVICQGLSITLIDFSLAGTGDRWIDDASMLDFEFAWSGGVAAGLGLDEAEDVVGVLAWAAVIALEIVTVDNAWVRPSTLVRNQRRLERIMRELG